MFNKIWNLIYKNSNNNKDGILSKIINIGKGVRL